MGQAILLRNPPDPRLPWMKVVGGRIAGFEPSGSHPDAEGWVLPSFVDAHGHILATGLDLQKLDLRGLDRDQALDALRDAHLRLAPDQWLLAVNMDQNLWKGARHLTVWELDAVSPGRPCLVRHVSGHASVCNHLVFELAGISNRTRDPRRGAFGRTKKRALNGLALESAHDMVSAHVPKPSLEQMVDAILAAGQRAAAQGYGTLTELMMGWVDPEMELEAYRLAAEAGCPVRLRLYAKWGCVYQQQAPLVPGWGDDRVRLNGLKLFADGAIGAGTAAVSEPYLTGGRGRLLLPKAQLAQRMSQAEGNGWSVAVHVIGDRAVEALLDAMATLQDPHRHRIEHAMVLDVELIDRLGGHTVVVQPEFLSAFREAYRVQLDPVRFSKLKPLRSLFQAGAKLALSTDIPVVTGDPWVSVNNSCRRPDGYDQSENLSYAGAMEAATRGAARANNDPDLGDLAIGCWADFCVYNDPWYRKLDSVWSGGRKVWPA